MPADDLLYILVWWLMLLVLTLVNYPLTARLFSRFVDRGYIFAKILGILLLSYVVYVLGTLHIAPFTFITIISILLVLVLVNIAILIAPKWKVKGEPFTLLTSQVKLALVEEFLFLLILYLWSYVRAHQPAIEGLEKLMDYGFIKSILASNYFPPQDMWLSPAPPSTEFKPEITNMLKGFYINYYYFGHLVAAVLTKLSQLPAAVTYNLQLATIAAFTFAGSFSLGVNLISTNRREASEGTPKNRSRRTTPRKGTEEVSLSLRKLIFAGLLTAYLVTFSGNLHTIYSLTPGYSPKDNELPPPPWNLKLDTKLTDYWYPNATRFIPLTIHEFPAYSFIVSDLHGHVSNIPFVLLMLAVLFNLLNIQQHNTTSKIEDRSRRSKVDPRKDLFSCLQLPNLPSILYQLPTRVKSLITNYQSLITKIAPLGLIGWLLAIFYMTNSWDTLVYGLLTLIVLLATSIFWTSNTNDRGSYLSKYGIRFVVQVVIIGAIFLVSSLPFNYFFHPFSSKIGVNCGYEILDALGVTHILQETPPAIAYSDAPLPPQTISLGPFLFEPGDCQKTPLWMHFILWGFFYYSVFGFITLILRPSLKWPALKPNNQKTRIGNQGLTRFKYPVSPTHLFLLLLILISFFLLWIPEFAYIKDIYPAHFRANTMFKLSYQAFIMLSLVAGYTIIRIFSNFKFQISNFNKQQLLRMGYVFFLIPQLLLVTIYPLFGINSYYGSLTNYRGLYGLNWLRERYPDDYNAVLWLDGQTEALCGDKKPSFNSSTPGVKSSVLKNNACPVILEAVGDSYTMYSRVSANTGLPTIIGWPVHEWLWRGSYDEAGKRKGEVETIYTSQDFGQVQPLLAKYNVEYVFVGDLEREKYPNLNEKMFQDLGTVVYQSGNTRIYKLNDIGY